jgi:phosphate transport system permease protein
MTASVQTEPAVRQHAGSSAARLIDRAMRVFIWLNGALAIVIVGLIFLFLLRDTLPVFKTVSLWQLLRGQVWDPLGETFGFLPLLLGSLWVAVGSVAIAVPIGLACAIYIAEMAPARVRLFMKGLVEILAGIPSVVLGFIGVMVVGPWIKETFDLIYGQTLLAGALLLAFMALPTIISISDDALTAVPNDFRAGSLALGATRLQTILRTSVPAAKSGIIAAVMLGIGRAIGETMTVLMVTGNAAQIPKTLLAPGRTMTATIAAEMGETVQFSPHYHALFAIGLVLFVITFLVNTTADLALRRVRH